MLRAVSTEPEAMNENGMGYGIRVLGWFCRGMDQLRRRRAHLGPHCVRLPVELVVAHSEVGSRQICFHLFRKPVVPCKFNLDRLGVNIDVFDALGPVPRFDPTSEQVVNATISSCGLVEPCIRENACT